MRLSVFLLLTAIIFASPAQGGLIFLDDYEGVPMHQVITDVLRNPTVGPANSAIWIKNVG